MIWLTKLNGKEFVLNSSLIEIVEQNPDTTITTTAGRRLVVKESANDVIEKMVEYRHRIYGGDVLKRQ